MALHIITETKYICRPPYNIIVNVCTCAAYLLPTLMHVCYIYIAILRYAGSNAILLNFFLKKTP